MHLFFSNLTKSVKPIKKTPSLCLYFKSIFMGAKYKCSKFYKFLKTMLIFTLKLTHKSLSLPRISLLYREVKIVMKNLAIDY